MSEKKLEILEQICDLLDETSSNKIRLAFLSLSYSQLIFLKNAIDRQIASMKIHEMIMSNARVL